MKEMKENIQHSTFNVQRPKTPRGDGRLGCWMLNVLRMSPQLLPSLIFPQKLRAFLPLLGERVGVRAVFSPSKVLLPSGADSSPNKPARRSLGIRHSSFVIRSPRRSRLAGHSFGHWMFLLILVLPLSLSAQSATNIVPSLAPAHSEMLPPLAPAYGEIKPTLWEQHGTAVLIAGFVLIALAGLIGWLICRSKPAVVVPPDILVRRSLMKLQSQPENGNVLSEISQTLCRYIITAFKLPSGELTTSEFSAALAANQQVGPELAQSVSGFLRECDERKFSTRNSPAPLNAASRALELVGQTESRIRQVTAATPTASIPKEP